MKENITFVIPAFNDEKTIETVIRKSKAVAQTLHVTFTILVVNDASSDATENILKKLKKTIPELSVITHTTNAGFGQTIKELYEKAGHTWLFSLPGDYQIEPKELLTLWPYRQKVDMLLGWRNKRNDSSVRLLQTKIYNGLLRFLFHLPLHDANSVRLMRSSLCKKIHLTSRSAFVDAELAIRAKKAGFRIIEIPIAHRARSGEGAGGGKLTTIFPTILDMILFFIKG